MCKTSCYLTLPPSWKRHLVLRRLKIVRLISFSVLVLFTTLCIGADITPVLPGVVVKPQIATSLIGTNEPVARIKYYFLPLGQVPIDNTLTNAPFLAQLEGQNVRFTFPVQSNRVYEIQTKVWLEEEWHTDIRFTAPKDDVFTSFYPIDVKEESRYFRVMSN